MLRSSKKGPYVDTRLLGRIEDMNRASEKRVLRTWSRASTIFPQMVGHTIAVHWTAAAINRCTSPRIWSAISWASLRRRASSAATAARRPISAGR